MLLSAVVVSVFLQVEPLPRVLVFSRTDGFRHGSIDAGVEALRSLGGDRFAVECTEDPSWFSPDRLKSFDAVVFNNTTQDILDDEQQRAFESWYRNGGGLVGIHAAADTEYDWPWYGMLLGGAYFTSHPQVQSADVVVEDRFHPAMRHLPATWNCVDEWYDYRVSPRGKVHVLARLDHESYEGERMQGDHPIVWCQVRDGGTAFYTGRGHTDESFAEPAFLEHLRQGILWVIADGWMDLASDENVDTAWRDADGWRMVPEVRRNDANPRTFDLDSPVPAAATEGPGVLVNQGPGPHGDLVSIFEHGDAELHLEFMVVEGGNSGVYLQGRYEIQILDSHGREKPKAGDCGGVYERWDERREPHGFEGHPPVVNASREPFRWQTYDIVFRAPKFDAEGTKIANARLERVVHNGRVIHEDVELTGPTRGSYPGEVAVGPLRLQGDHGPIAYRNIRIRPLGSD